MVKHVVLFSYKEDVSSNAINQIAARFLNLKNRIDQVRHIECGLNNSPENLGKGYHHLFQLFFDSIADRDSYLVHPEHKSFSKFAQPSLNEVLVFDYSLFCSPEGHAKQD